MSSYNKSHAFEETEILKNLNHYSCCIDDDSLGNEIFNEFGMIEEKIDIKHREKNNIKYCSCEIKIPSKIRYINDQYIFCSKCDLAIKY